LQDEPLPEIKSTVVVGALEGNPDDLVLIRQYGNLTNPPDDKQADPVNDSSSHIPGDKRETVAGDYYHGIGGDREDRTDGNYTIKCDGQKLSVSCPLGDISITATDGSGEILIQGSFLVQIQQGGAYMKAQNGTWEFGNANGQKWQFGGGGAWNWDVAGGAIEITNAADVKINGRSIVVVGTKDSGGDTNNQGVLP
jgi:hypothetical protein